MVEDEALVALMGHLLEEAKSVATAIGVLLLRDDYRSTVVDVCREREHHRSSMLQDVLAKRRTEIDEINGAIVDYGGRVGVETPYIGVVTPLVRGFERCFLDRPSGGER